MEPFHPSRMRLPSPVRAVILLAGVTIFAALVITFARKPPAPQPLEPLAAFVESHGTPVRMHPISAKFFGIPGESVVFTQCSAISDSGRTRSIGIRRRPELGHVDILLIDRPSGGDASYFYLTSPAGELVTSTYLDTEPRIIEDAVQRFEHERDFWLNWKSEKMKHDAK